MALKLKEINIPIFNYKVSFISGGMNEVVKFLKDTTRTQIDFNPNCDACTIVHDGSATVLFNEHTITIPIITHEIIHVVFAMISHLGLDLQDQEVFCYTTEYLLDELIKYTDFN